MLGLMFGNSTCVADTKEAKTKLAICKSEFSAILSSFDALQSYLNTEDRKNLAWLNYFLNSEYTTENTAQLIELFKAFRRACIKIEILTVQHETQNTSFLVENAVSDLTAEKIKLQVLYDLCLSYYKNRDIYTIKNIPVSNKDLTKFVLKALPEQFRLSFFANVLRWFNKTSRDLSWLKAFLSQDFYLIETLLCEEYLGLVASYNAFVLFGKSLNISTFTAQIDELVNKLFAATPYNQYTNNVVELLIAKLIYIKNQAVALDIQQTTSNQNSAQLKLFSKFKVLMQNKNFRTFRLNKNFGHIFDLFINKIQRFFATKDLAQTNLAELFELEQLIINLKEENLPQEPGKLFKLLKIFDSGFKKQNLIIILDEMLVIVTGAINEITKTDSKNGRSILGDGMTLIHQLKDVGFDGTTLKDIAGAFLNQKFKNTQDAVIYIAAKTGPAWLAKVVPFLPEEIRGTVSSILNLLVETKSSTDGLFEMIGNGSGLLTALANDQPKA